MGSLVDGEFGTLLEPSGDGNTGLTQTPHGLLRYRSRALDFLRRVSKRGVPKCPLVDLGADSPSAPETLLNARASHKDVRRTGLSDWQRSTAV